jgi:hypothetical protein
MGTAAPAVAAVPNIKKAAKASRKDLYRNFITYPPDLGFTLRQLDMRVSRVRKSDAKRFL